MKKVLSIVLAAALVTAPFAASAAKEPAPKRNYHEHSIFQQLELTEQQQEALKEIFQEQRRAIQVIRENTETSIASILTSDQQKQLTKLKKERAEKWKQERKQYKKHHKGEHSPKH